MSAGDARQTAVAHGLLQQENGLFDARMTTVADILKAKPVRTVHAIEATASVFDAVKLMAEANVGALVVVEHGQLVGIVSERDCARKVILPARSARDTPVHQIMSAPVLVVRADRTGDECMALMTENRLRHLPVMDGAKLVGMVSIGDLVKQVVSDQRFVIEQLEHYISGERS
jgi:CBS domain-containing protein